MPPQGNITYAKDGTPLDTGVVNLAKSMRAVESQNNYNARGKSGEFGAYQWTEPTWMKHAQLAGVDPNDRSPMTQDKVAYKVIEARKNAGLTPEQIISEWNSGNPNAYTQNHRGRNTLGVAYDTPAHVAKVIAEFRRLKQQTPSQSAPGVPQDSLRGDLQKRKEQFVRGQEKVATGEINPGRGALRAAGAVAGGIGDTAFRALSALTPDAIGEPATQALGGIVGSVMKTPLAQKAVGAFQKLDETRPEVAQDIRDIGNIAGAVPFGVGGGITASAAKSGAKGAIRNAAERQVAGLAEDYAEIFGTRAPLRGRIQRAEDKGRDLSAFLAEKAQGPTGAKLEVDSDGSVDASKLMLRNEEDLQKLLGARADLLKQYPEQGDVETLRQMALKAADSSSNKAKAIVGEVQNEINGIFDNLKATFGERIPLDVLQDIKIAQRQESKVFNALNPKRDRGANANYLTSDAARRYIEDITKNPLVRELNDVIGQHLDADDLLERIKVGGAKVKGSRLGKYAGAGIGSMVGSTLESAFGPILGGYAGHHLVGLILQNKVSGPLRNYLLKRLEATEPDVFKEVQKFVGEEELRRASMLQLPAAGQSSFKGDTIFGREKGPGSTNLQEAVDAQGVTGLVPPPKAGQSALPQSVPTDESLLQRTVKGAKKKVQGVIEDFKSIPRGEAGFVKNPLANPGVLPKNFKGFKDLTTHIIDDLKGRSTISKQYLLDATNRPNLKQAERDLIRRLLEDEGDVIVAKDFAKRVKTELLPLNVTARTRLPKNVDPDDPSAVMNAIHSEPQYRSTRYESINLPDELRGPVADYDERVYQSPIKTSAGSVHFSDGYAHYGDVPNYFAHTRIEDLPPKGAKAKIQPFIDDDYSEAGPGSTRRVIEIQSDLFQKGRLEGEAPRVSQQGNGKWGVFTRNSSDPVGPQFATEAEAKAFANKDIAKLEPYRNTWWERIVREEVKQAAKDGKTKLQFPTGETAMKIEGLGQRDTWVLLNKKGSRTDDVLEMGNMKVGQSINRIGDADEWVITDVLGDGKFKAAPKGKYDKRDMLDIKQYEETFDISGKVDTQNPIYRFYEKDVQKYLTKKYGGKVITDPQGVKWVEIDVPKDAAKLPVEAFGAVPFLTEDEES